MKIDDLLGELIIGDVLNDRDDPVGWIEREFYIPELSGPMKLAPYHKAVLREAYRRDEDGKFVYSVVVWSDIKKSIKCLGPNVPVLLASGAWLAAEEVQTGDVVMAYGDEKLVPRTVRAVEKQPEAPMYRITTSRGRVLDVTGEHTFLVRGHGMYPGYKFNQNAKELHWKNAADLEASDRVVVALDWMRDTASFQRSDFDEFYALGAMVGDGSCHSGIFTNETQEIIDRVARRFKMRPARPGHYYLYQHGPFLRQYGLWRVNTRGKRVPWQVFANGRQVALAFLAGYIDTDGHVNKPTSRRPLIQIGGVNRELLEDCQRLLAGLGINAILRDSYTTLNGRRFDCYYLAIQDKAQFIKFAKMIDLASPKKSERLKGWLERLERENGWVADSFTTDRIVSVEQLPPSESVAIEVDDLHTHVTAGIVTHNSSIAAAVALHRAFHTPYGMIKIIANDLKQADSRVAYYARRAVELNPRLAARVRVINYRMSFDNKAFIEAIPVDPKGEAGGNDDFICFSELWAANQSAAIRMWTESTLSPTKFGQSQRWVETYAGFRGESPLLENLWDAGVNQGVKLDLSYADEAGNWVDLRDLEVYANHGMLVMWNGIPRCEWQTNESGRKYYEEEARVLRPEEFNRVHRNQWATASSPFIPIEWWDKCQTEQLQPLDEFQTVIVGMDAATTNDTFAIVTVSRTKEKVELREVRVFVPPKNGKLDFAQPEAYLRDLCSRFRVSAVVYDPYQLHELCTRLMKEGIAYFETFQQGAPRLKADKMLYDVIAGGRIAHDGSYPVMREHLLNASATSGENLRTDQMRIVKRVSSGNPIDAVVAMSMAVERAIFYNIGDF